MDCDFNCFNDLELEMPWFKCGRKDTSDVNYKSRVEQKLLLARQNPEPVFDLTDCNLLDVPTGVYAWCKVCLKQRLLLQNNRLKSVTGGGNISDLFNLRLLELSHNNLSKLPEELCSLSNLQALYLHHNRLKSLPESFNHLKNIQVLNLKNNCFKTFPHSICLLLSLKKLDISANSIHELPDSLINLKDLDVLVIDNEIYDYPPTHVCQQGLPTIFEFLCQENGKERCSANRVPVCQFSLDSGVGTSDEDTRQQVNFQQEQHLQALMENERSLQELYERLAETQDSKQNFLKDLIKDQDRLDEELSNAQNRKDQSHQKLLCELIEVEQQSNYVIEELLAMSRESRTSNALLETLENERREFEKLFISVQNEASNLSRKEVIEAMETTLENQYREAKNQLNAYNWAHKELLARTQLNELTQALRLEEIMTKCGEDQASLIAQLLQDEEYQKQAFAGLMMRKDEQYIRLSDQISLIENELANLTLLELRRRELQVETEKNLIEDRRIILTDLLLQLIVQQEQRSKEFENRLLEMEAKRSQEQVDFWLRQYQKLLENKPDILKHERYLHDEIKAVLNRAGANHLGPVLADLNIGLADFRRFNDERLQQIGVDDCTVREAILRELQVSRDDGAAGTSVRTLQQTAIQSSTNNTSFRARFEVECVVCMERVCSVLYLNCGHVCCCAKCAPSLKLCPMCRSTIERIILLTHPPSAPSL